MRAMKRFPVTKENLQPRIIYVGLNISDSVVMNQHRKSQGTRVGNFVGEGSGGSFSGVTAGTSRSTSTTYGDLVFFAKGKEILRFQEISDPHDVHIMIETVKKQRARL